MKKLLFIIAVLLIGCSTPEECKCTGEFRFTYDPSPVFNVKDVDCKTGDPFMSDNQKEVIKYLGCKK